MTVRSRDYDSGQGAGYSPFLEPVRTQLRGGGIHRWAEDCFLNCLGSLASNLAELAHPEGAEGEQDVRQTRHVALERVSVPLDRSLTR